MLKQDYGAFRRATVADAVLADSTLGRTVHYAVRCDRLQYDGSGWYFVVRPLLVAEPKLEVITWLRHWLTEGVIELTPPSRRYPDPLDRLPRVLRFTGDWADPAYAHSHNLWNCNCARTGVAR